MARSLLAGLSLLFVLLRVVEGAITVSRTLNIDGEPYYLPHESLTEFSGKLGPAEVLPLSVISTNATKITGDVLKATIEGWQSTDDVFSESFLQCKLKAT